MLMTSIPDVKQRWLTSSLLCGMVVVVCTLLVFLIIYLSATVLTEHATANRHIGSIRNEELPYS